MSDSLLISKNGNEPTAPQQEAEGFIKATLDALTENIAILDNEGVIIHVNKAWRAFDDVKDFGAGYALGSNYLILCDTAVDHMSDAALIAQGIRDVAQHKSDEFYLEYPCHTSGERRWYMVRITCFQWYNQNRLIIAHQNITAIKQASVDLEESKQRLEAILENLVDGIITFDEHGTIETLNSAAAYIFGYDREEIVGQNVNLLVPALQQAGTNGSMVDFITHLGSLGDELDGRHKDGSIFPMYFAVSQLSLGEKRLFTAIIQDFTERKYFESQLWDKERLNVALDKERELRDLKNRFISMMSHELRTPLAAIKLANSMLQMYGEKSSLEEKWESYEAIDQQVEYLTELVSDVMTISKADFTGAEFEAETVDLETYCRDVIEHIMLAYQMKRGIEFDGLNKRVEARVDTKLLRRALTNLLTNAIKYSPDDKSILVTLTVSDQCEAIIRVSDHGIGIPKEDLPHLFEPFHRAANVGKIHGTGLGLAIAKQAIELHGGHMAVESQVGIGTTFTVYLPLPVTENSTS